MNDFTLTSTRPEHSCPCPFDFRTTGAPVPIIGAINGGAVGTASSSPAVRRAHRPKQKAKACIARDRSSSAVCAT